MTDAAERLLVDELVQLSFTVMGLLTRVAASNDVSLTQLRMLAILRDRTPRMADLAAYLGLDRSTVSGLIDRAEKRGLVQRIASEADGRSTHVGLTASGQALAAKGALEVATAAAPLTARLTPRDHEALTSLLENLLSPATP